MKDYKNQKWTMKDIAQQYKKENPDWSWKKCWKKANIVYKELTLSILHFSNINQIPFKLSNCNA